MPTPLPPSQRATRATPLIWALKTMTMCTVKFTIIWHLSCSGKQQFWFTVHSTIIAYCPFLAKREIPLDVLNTPRDCHSFHSCWIRTDHQPKSNILHTASDRVITVRVYQLLMPIEQKLLGQANKTTSIRPQTTLWNVLWRRNLDHMAWLTNYQVTFVLDGRLLQYSSVHFITAFGGNKSTGCQIYI